MLGRASAGSIMFIPPIAAPGASRIVDRVDGSGLQLSLAAYSFRRELSGKKLFRSFEDHGFDGMRCDVDGNLYITRHGKGTVVKMTPAGKILREIPVLGSKPSNICFGGPDGCTAYVTEMEHRRLVQFRVDRPGLAWQRWQK